MDPDPDSESGSSDLIGSGSEKILIFKRRLSCKKHLEVIF
jgi:hypothetical protein